MKFNVGTIDRVLRIVAGLVLIALAVTGTVGWWAGWGHTTLYRAVSFCPAYTSAINTCPLEVTPARHCRAHRENMQ